MSSLYAYTLLAGVALATVTGVTGYLKGRADADRSAELKELKGQILIEKDKVSFKDMLIEQIQEDVQAAQKIAEDAAQRAADRADESVRLRDQVNALEEELRNAPEPAPAPVNGACPPSRRMSDRDVRVHLNIGAERAREDVAPAPAGTR